MADGNQLGFGDGLLSKRQKISKLSKHLTKLDQIIDWKPLVREISIIDKTNGKTDGRPRKNPLWMIKATFLQSLFSLSDPQLEDQLIDRLSFQRFVGINLDQKIPDFNTFWRFKEALSAHNLDQRIFELINQQLEAKGLIVKKGTIVDASIIPSTGRPLSGLQKKRNRKLSNFRSAVEHPSAWMKTKTNLVAMRAKNETRNRLRFMFAL